MTTCVFCKIVQGEDPERILYQDEDVTAFYDANPQAPVHVLIVPNRHIASLAQAKPGDEVLLGKLFATARHVAQMLNMTSGHRLVVNTGHHGGQVVFHLHIHLLGGRLMMWPPG